MTKTFISLALLIGLAFSWNTLGGTASAQLNGDDFPFGNIIDDAIFTDKDTMTVEEIQTFLESKVTGGECDRNRPTYNPSYNPPWTCLFEFQQNPDTGVNNYGLFESDGTPSTVPGGKTAAEIIWQAGQDHDINPQVLIVLLQKEQGLVTDNWPWTIQYSRATGYLCPDTAPCDPSQADFYKQVDGAASLFRYYLDNLESYWYGIGSNDILYNPNHACGRKTINIENAATVALYLYTPYTPNQAALDNLYGTGDSCSAYGNRNFWRYFRDWFGAVHVDAYNYSFHSSSNANIQMEPGDYISGAYIRLLNTGSETWYRDGSQPSGIGPTRLAIVGYDPSYFADLSDPSWLGGGTQIQLLEQEVQPGSMGTFRFDLRAPYEKTGTFEEIYFRPVVDGVSAMPFKGLRFTIEHIPPKYKIAAGSALPTEILPGQEYSANVIIRNSGRTTWYSDGNTPSGTRPVRLTLNNYAGTPYSNSAIDPDYLAPSQVKMQEASVAPGENANFSFTLRAPIDSLSDRINLALVLDGVDFFERNPSWYFWPSTPTPVTDYRFAGAVNPPSSETVGTSYNAELTIRNTGNISWGTSAKEAGTLPLRLVIGGSYANPSNFYLSGSTGWIAPSQIEYTGPVVGPGETATFNFDWTPENAGTFSESMVPVLDGYSVMDDRGMRFNVTSVLP